MAKVTLNNLANLQNELTAINIINTNNDAIEVAMENTLSRDGTAPNTMGANLDMNSNHILNLPQPATASEPLRLQDLSSFTGGGTVTNIPAGGTTGQALEKTSAVDYAVGWANTVNSVGLSLPADFTVTGSPVTTTGTLTGTFVNTPTGTGGFVRQTTPTLITPILGVATATTVNKVTITQPASGSTLTIPDGVVLTGPAASGTAMTLGNNETVTGVKTFGAAGNVGKLVVAGTTSGTTVLNATAAASGTLTLPAATDTLIAKATTDTLTNKTYDTAGAGNSFLINSLAATANTGTGAVVRATTPTLVTPVLGVATATTINGSTVSPGHYSGEPTTGNAAAGEIGEFISSNVVIGSAVALTTGTPANITSISLTAGDWDVTGGVFFNPAATTSMTRYGGDVTLTTASSPSLPGSSFITTQAAFVPGSGNTLGFGVGPLRVSISGTTSVFLTCVAVFTVSTLGGYGLIRARRVR